MPGGCQLRSTRWSASGIASRSKLRLTREVGGRGGPKPAFRAKVPACGARRPKGRADDHTWPLQGSSQRKLSIPPPYVDQAIGSDLEDPASAEAMGWCDQPTSVHKLPWLAPCVFGWIGRGRASNRCCCFLRALTNASPTMNRV